jgi:hypothetical protein
MIFSDDRTTKDALLNTLGEELAAAWVRFYAIEVDSRPGELEYDRALAAAKKLEAAIAEIVATGGGSRREVGRSARRAFERTRRRDFSSRW